MSERLVEKNGKVWKIYGLYYITLCRNLKSIMDHGILSRNMVNEKRLRTDKRLANSEIIDTRSRKNVGDNKLQDYVNLYFTPVNPMLSVVRQKFRSNELAIIQVKPDLIGDPKNWVTDGNAASTATKFRRLPEGIQIVDFEVVFEKQKDIVSIQKVKRKKMAEVLVKDCVERNMFNKIFFYSKKNKLILPDQDVVVPVVVPKDFRLLATSLGSKDPDIKDTIRYVRSRGLTNRDLWYFKFGTCATGRYRRRVIMPSFDEVGDINYFVARTIDQDDKKMKYINAKVSKKNVIFNEINIDWDRELTLVEGPFDLTKCDSNSTSLSTNF